MSGVPDDLISLVEACRLLPGVRPGKHLNISTLYRWVQVGTLPGWKIRRNIFVRRSDVLRLAVPVAVRPQLEPAANQSEANLWADRYLAERGLL